MVGLVLVPGLWVVRPRTFAFNSVSSGEAKWTCLHANEESALVTNSTHAEEGTPKRQGHGSATHRDCLPVFDDNFLRPEARCERGVAERFGRARLLLGVARGVAIDLALGMFSASKRSSCCTGMHCRSWYEAGHS